jgi:hypothetical protein
MPKGYQLLRMAIGRYTQMRGIFSDGKNGRCAVGAIYSMVGWDGKIDEDHNKDYANRARYRDMIWKSKATPYILYYTPKCQRACVTTTVPDLNDKYCLSFEEIADIMEENNI